MTSQIAIFNERCVAVASDSVVTVGRGDNRRTMSTADKIFDTGADHPVVILHSGAADFMNVPYEVLVAEWRRTLGEPFDTLDEYADSFCAWLVAQQGLFGGEAQDRLFTWLLDDIYFTVRGNLRDALERENLANEPWDSLSVMNLVNEVVAGQLRALESRNVTSGCDEASANDWVAARQELVTASFDWVFDDVPHTQSADRVLKEQFPALIVTRCEPWSIDATVAFVGYGGRDTFPGHRSRTITGIINDCLLWRPHSEAHISQGIRGTISPFGQDEAVQTFIRAYNSRFLSAAHVQLDEVLDDLLDEEQEDLREGYHEKLEERFDELSWEYFVRPMVDTVTVLPRADMIRMAESLVGVQALRAASGTEMPSVGGPIDIALITRSDGVQWVRRKDPVAEYRQDR